jgi:sugar phosphate isomerase/epimerase
MGRAAAICATLLPMDRQRSPRDFTNADLVLSYFSLDRKHPMEDRIAAVASAGFSGMGLYIGEYQRLKSEGLADGWLDETLSKYQMVVAEIEVVSAWARPGADDRGFEASAWEMADRWDCRYLQAIGPYDGSITEAGDAFGALCDRANEHGLVVGLEFLPFTNIYDARDGMRIVDQASRDNGGLCVDIWHHARGANDLDLIRVVPPERIMGIQMSDGPKVQELSDYKDDCLRRRVPPGEGELGAREFVSTLIDVGVTVPWSLEVCSDHVWGQVGPVAAAHAQRCADGMNNVLDSALN